MAIEKCQGVSLMHHSMPILQIIERGLLRLARSLDSDSKFAANLHQSGDDQQAKCEPDDSFSGAGDFMNGNMSVKEDLSNC